MGFMLKIVKKIRNYYLVKIRWRNFNIGKNFHAGRNVFIWAKESVVIGDNFYIGRYSQIETNVKIGNNVLIGNNVAFVGKYDHNYLQVGMPVRFSSQIRDKDYGWKGLDSKIIIEDDVWIGYGAIIMSDIKIGMGSVVAAGSVITKDVKPYTIVAGNPAKMIKMRFNDEERKNHESILYSISHRKL